MSAPSIPEFVADWQRSTLSERSAAQQHFIGLCEILGQPTPANLTDQEILTRLLQLNLERSRPSIQGRCPEKPSPNRTHASHDLPGAA